MSNISSQTSESSLKPLSVVLHWQETNYTLRRGMNILLLSMPDSFEHMPEVVVRIPNGALSSLAGNIDPHHTVAVADLILVQRHVRQTIDQLVRDLQPDVVGLSVMTFQRETAKKIMTMVRKLRP